MNTGTARLGMEKTIMELPFDNFHELEDWALAFWC